jgi:hypothetical protein
MNYALHQNMASITRLIQLHMTYVTKNGINDKFDSIISDIND